MTDDKDETVFRVGAPSSTEVDWTDLVVWGRASVTGSTGICNGCVVPKERCGRASRYYGYGLWLLVSGDWGIEGV
jgi:hypothetical protein